MEKETVKEEKLISDSELKRLQKMKKTKEIESYIFKEKVRNDTIKKEKTKK